MTLGHDNNGTTIPTRHPLTVYPVPYIETDHFKNQIKGLFNISVRDQVQNKLFYCCMIEIQTYL